MPSAAYLRHPTIAGDNVVFVSEDDLWSVDASGGVAHRLTANPGSITRPKISPSGETIAFVSRDEGVLDAFVMNIDGSDVRRLTHFGSVAAVAGWGRDGASVMVVSDHDQAFAGFTQLWEVPLDGGPPRRVPVGHAWSIATVGEKGLVLGRNTFDPARWKRYRGGRTGQIWIDAKGSGSFLPLVDLPGNLADPMSIGRRIYFLSDHEGVGNIYSVTPTGRNLKRHTDHDDFYARFPSSDGARIVYHAGADLYLLDPADDVPTRIRIEVPSSRPQRNRRFVSASRFLTSFDLHPEGHSVAFTSRGSSLAMPLWEGAPTGFGTSSEARERLTTWLPDGKRLVSITDIGGEEKLSIRSLQDGVDDRLIELDLGRVRSIDPAPARKGVATRIATTNHRHEVHLVDADTGKARLIHRSSHSWIGGSAWSPDGRWLAFCSRATETTQDLYLYEVGRSRLHRIGRGEFVDHSPAFDPSGQFLYFLSSRIMDPVSDSIFHNYGFPTSTVVMVAPLTKGAAVPFRVASKEPRAPGGNNNGNGSTEDVDVLVKVDVDGLMDRAESMPIPAGRHVSLGLAEGKVFVLTYPVRGALGTAVIGAEPSKGTLSAFDLASEMFEPVVEGVTGFAISGDAKTLGLWNGRRLRVVPIGWKDDKAGKEQVGRSTGFVDLDRAQIAVVPGDEWRQMFTEAWRLQREYFWSPDMTGVDWLGIHQRYLALVDRVSSRSEFSDLLWEMQGELGTSHAYELGGEYRPEPAYSLGRLGADFEWSRGAWRVTAIPKGDSWNPHARSPLSRSGADVAVGDRLLAMDGVELDRRTYPTSALVDRGGKTVNLTVASGRRKPRSVAVETLRSETALRYRDWVENNRAHVRETTDGRCGYIHIPDMLANGFAEFHRGWRHEVTAEGLVIDVRFNRGGNVSQLLLDKLLRQRLGYRVTRWREPYLFPPNAVAGPMVCLTNEFAGSDGDIFSHTFKMRGLGPLIGTRTWGGVVGIWTQQALVDGTVTTQPEFATWFSDVEFEVENRGTDPDIEVVIAPHDYRAGRDPQMDRGLTELLKLVDAAESEPPDFTTRPTTKPPRLPAR